MENFVDDKTANNSEIACQLCNVRYTYDEIISELTTNNVIRKQACIIHLDEIHSQDDTNKLVGNLTGQDGRIREVTAFKINELIKNTNYNKFFQEEYIVKELLKGTVDVNPAICRFIIDSLDYIQNKEYVLESLVSRIIDIITELKTIDKALKKHMINKKIFKIYWSIEALTETLKSANKCHRTPEITEIIDALIDFKDYTIREKIYKLLNAIYKHNKSEAFESYLQKLQVDDNFYVTLN